MCAFRKKKTTESISGQRGTNAAECSIVIFTSPSMNIHCETVIEFNQQQN